MRAAPRAVRTRAEESILLTGSASSQTIIGGTL
jgi:hypothetical protein